MTARPAATVPSPTTDSPPPTRSAGWDIVEQAKAALREGSLVPNTPASVLHVDASGRVLLAVPGFFEWYETLSGVPAKTGKNRFIRLKLHTIKDSKVDLFSGRYPGSNTPVRGVLVPDGSWFSLDPLPLGTIDIR